MLRRVVLVSIASALAPPGCAGPSERGTSSAPPAAAERAPAPASPLDVAPLAVDVVDAVEGEEAGPPALTRALKAALMRTSGAPAVDRFEVEAELRACAAPSCATPRKDLYVGAPVTLSASVTKTGSAYLATGTARGGASIVARASASDDDPIRAVEKMGWELGARVREHLDAGGHEGEKP